MMEVARSSVQTWECDQMGHMNVQFYVEKATQALAVLGIHLGLDPAGRDGAKLVARAHHIRYLRELRPGAPFYLRAGVLEIGTDELKIHLEMLHASTEVVAAAFTAPAALVKPDGTRLSLPQALREKAATLKMEQPAHGRPRGLQLHAPRKAPSPDEAGRLGMVRSLICQVLPEHCDRDGSLLTHRYIGMISDAMPNLLAYLGSRDDREPEDAGMAALEYRLVYRALPNAGDTLFLRSGLKEVGAKTYTLCHWLFDQRTGQAVGTFEAVAITLDLQARKSIPVPVPVRRRLEPLTIPELLA